MNVSDPYTPSGASVYECRDCLTRVESRRSITACPECGSTVQNLAVPRE